MAVTLKDVHNLKNTYINDNNDNPLINEVVDVKYEMIKQLMFMVFKNTITLKPKRNKDVFSTSKNDREYGFTVIGKCDNPTEKDKKIYGHIPVRTYKTLLDYCMKDNSVFFTMNSFYRGYQKEEITDNVTGEKIKVLKSSRKKSDLRYANGFILDIDDVPDSYENEQAIVKRCAEIGIPNPTCINRTTSGYQVWFVFSENQRATVKAIKCYDIIVSNVIKKFNEGFDLFGDVYAKSANNYYRIPKDVRMIGTLEQCWTFGQYKAWSEKHCPFEKRQFIHTTKQQKVEGEQVDFNNLMNCTPVKNVLKGVVDGHRNKVAFGLSTILYVSGYSKTNAFKVLREWNENNKDKQNKNQMLLSEIELRKHLNSVYDKFNHVSECTSLPLNIIYNAQKNGSVDVNIRNNPKAIFLQYIKKDRTDRVRSHYDEIINDIKLFLSNQENCTFTATQKELSELIRREDTNDGTATSSLHIVLKMLRESDYGITVETTLGRYGKTTLTLKETLTEGNDRTNYRKVVYLNEYFSRKKSDDNVACFADVISSSFSKNLKTQSFIYQRWEGGWLASLSPNLDINSTGFKDDLIDSG